MSGINFSSFNIVDFAILFIFLISMVIGFGRGFISEFISLVTTIAAFIVAIYFTSPLAGYFTSSAPVQGVVSQTSSAIGVSTSTPVSYMALGLSFALLFAGTVIVGAIVKSLLNMIFSYGILGVGNSLLGGLFGLVKGFFYNLVLIFLIQLSPLGTQPVFAQSQLVIMYQPTVQSLATIVSPTLSNLKAKIGNAVEGVGSTIQGLSNSI